MTLSGGETPGKKTVHLKGGGTFTAEYVKGNLLRAGYWYGKGEYAAKGRFTKLADLEKASQDKRDGRGNRRGSGGGGTAERGESWLSLLGLTKGPEISKPKAGRVTPPKHNAQTDKGKKTDKWSIGWRD